MDDGELRALLDAVLAEERTGERARRRTIARAMTEDAGLVGTLIDLAEGAQEVVVRTSSGRAHRGRVRFVGADFVVLDAGIEVWLQVSAIGSVTAERLLPPAAGDRTGADVLLVEALDRLVSERATVTVVVPGDVVTGTLVAVGADVLTIEAPGGARRTYVSAGTGIELLRSG
jgi:hypothetical protein